MQIYKAGDGCRWLESRLAIITEKNEPNVLEGESNPSAQHTLGVISTGADWGASCDACLHSAEEPVAEDGLLI